MLLLPTERALFRFDLSRITPAAGAGGVREIAMAPPYKIPIAALAAPGTNAQAPFYGNSIAADGVLYTTTADRLLAYGRR